MAELQILGQILGTTDFEDIYSLFCRFSFQAGPNWTLISGCPEGQTVTAKPDYNKCVIWSHPLDVLYVTKGIQGWPKLNFQVSCLDKIGRSWVVGYGYYSLPAIPGSHSIKVPCWTPEANTLTDKIRQYFLGGSPQVIQTDIINLGTDRFKLKTKSTGHIVLEINLILKNFNQFGVEYK